MPVSDRKITLFPAAQSRENEFALLRGTLCQVLHDEALNLELHYGKPWPEELGEPVNGMIGCLVTGPFGAVELASIGATILTILIDPGVRVRHPESGFCYEEPPLETVK